MGNPRNQMSTKQGPSPSSSRTERIVVEIDIHADVVAGKSLGGIQLLDQIFRYWSLLREETSKRQLDYHQGEIHTVVYAVKKKPSK